MKLFHFCQISGLFGLCLPALLFQADKVSAVSVETDTIPSAVQTGDASSTSGPPTCAPFNMTEMMELILAEDYETMDPLVLPRTIEALKQRGAHRCWHKHSTFLQHLTGVHNILRLWGQGTTIGRVGLFHSAYSNSYVNLASERLGRQ